RDRLPVGGEGEGQEDEIAPAERGGPEQVAVVEHLCGGQAVLLFVGIGCLSRAGEGVPERERQQGETEGPCSHLASRMCRRYAAEPVRGWWPNDRAKLWRPPSRALIPRRYRHGGRRQLQRLVRCGPTSSRPTGCSGPQSSTDLSSPLFLNQSRVN